MKNQIRDRRRELGLSQKELAERCGVSRQTVNAIENDKYDPTLSLAFRLAKELQLTVWTSYSHRRNEGTVFLKRWNSRNVRTGKPT